jgi:hypothetical protein
MENTTWVHTEPTLLSKTEIYLIKGCLYSYKHKTTSGKYSQYYFQPLSGQRKKTELKVTQANIYKIVFVKQE